MKSNECSACGYYDSDDDICSAFVCDGLDCPELPCEKEEVQMKKRAERRRRTRNVIKQRIDKLSYLTDIDPVENGEIHKGQLENNNEMNKYAGCGTKPKTNTRKSCYHGGYGKAVHYKPHDQRQIDKGEFEDN